MTSHCGLRYIESWGTNTDVVDIINLAGMRAVEVVDAQLIRERRDAALKAANQYLEDVFATTNKLNVAYFTHAANSG